MRSNFPSHFIGQPVDHETIKARAYTDTGILVASIHDPRLDCFERQFLKNVGQKLYGGDRQGVSVLTSERLDENAQ